MVNPEDLIGKTIDGRYCLSRYIGTGAFGHVFEATEQFVGEEVSRVAIKLIYPFSEAELGAVRHEIQGLARLRHDHVIDYHACGPQDDLCPFVYVVTELAETSLREFMEMFRPLPDGQLREIAHGIASALAHIHAQSAVHRDVKPENILRAQGRWKLGDFGLSRPIHGTLVQGSCLAGTPAYLPPEALHGQIGPPTDVYALGVTLWECLTGHRAYQGKEWSEFVSVLRSQPSSPAIPLPSPWDEIIPECLKTDPRERCSAAAILERLNSPPTARGSGTASSRSSMRHLPQSNPTAGVPSMRQIQSVSLGPSVLRTDPIDGPRAPHWSSTRTVILPFCLGSVLCLSMVSLLHAKWRTSLPTQRAASSGKPAATAVRALSASTQAKLLDAERAWEAGDYAEAERRAAQIVTADRRNGAALKLLGAAALVRHAPAEGEQHYRSALQADGRDGEAWLGYASCLERQRLTGKARSAYRQALHFAGSNQAIQHEAQEGMHRAGVRNR